MMEIREVTTYNEKLPFSGYGIWVVFEMKYHKAHLVHPIHFSELILREYEYMKSVGGCLWPNNNTKTFFNKDRFTASIKDRVKFFMDNDRTFPVQLVARILAELEETTEKAQLEWIDSLNKQVSAEKGKPTLTLLDKASISYRLSETANLENVRGRPLAIVEALKTSPEPASIYQITHLVDGKLKTKSDLSRVVTYFVHKLASQGILEIVT
jgi:hypothetical protein